MRALNSMPLNAGHHELIRILARRAALEWIEANYSSDTEHQHESNHIRPLQHRSAESDVDR